MCASDCCSHGQTEKIKLMEKAHPSTKILGFYEWLGGGREGKKEEKKEDRDGGR